MASRIYSIHAILLFLLYASCPTRASSNEDFVSKQVERLVNNFNLAPRNSTNIVRDKVLEPARFVEKNFMFPGILPSNTHSIRKLGHHAGYFSIKNSYDARMFYFFFESRGKKSDPVVLWLTGGPGCASEIALFYENGPFHIKDDLSLKWNDFGWDIASNLLYIDQPTGTGFSYSSDARDIRTNETSVSNDLYDFLQTFFAAHPEFVKNDFYITGQSYAGHYIPALASRVQKGNKGLAIGNGLTNPEHQYPSYRDFALAKKLISQSEYEQLEQYNPDCMKEINQCQTGDDKCKDAYNTCTEILYDIFDAIDNINYYDIKKKLIGEMGYDFSNLEKFMDLAYVKKALGVENTKFVLSSSTVYNAMIEDWMKNYAPKIPPLLNDGIKVLIYAGEFDLICNWLGNIRWVDAMRWSGQRQFSKAKLTPYKVGGREVGLIKSTGPLTFLKVHNAGHMVPMDQPNVSLEMIKS